jgi:pimeloyl-ACP methyl ester carboxylesterase
MSLRILLLLFASLMLASGLRGQAPAIRTVTVDGRPMRVHVEGLAGRAPGAPIIVFESGAMNSLDVWGPILGRAARLAPVVAYDRSGLGRSAWDEQTPSPAHITAKLRRLLQEIGAPPPYVLVGWSWGGTLARFYAGFYPSDVAGVVYLDPGPIITNTADEEIAAFVEIGAERAGYDAFWAAFRGFVQRAAPAVRAEFDVFHGLMQRAPHERDLRPAPAVPVVMVIAAKPLTLSLPLPFDQTAYGEADVRHRIRLLQRWVLGNPNGTLIVATNTTHAIPREDPDLVVSAIERVLSAVRSARRE